ncbi:hypothetical protein D3Y59_01545 [Hymenobacter oligotrophus]|uniref:Uncharacterized protein n=1 Tax=Hymenobacter oligotrophus TaxID=2319843 RepID=A0A3B7QWD3_9BACT|nr:hypothetical protein [Hymenobacter oligotrophus]AYA35845.1 hypothetical protein D3Y59_01545 [Hymenobacter oligotrophus]
MKKLFAASFLLAACAVAPSVASAQTKPTATTTAASDAARYEYCELTVRNNGDIFSDFGYGMEKLGGGSLSKVEVGKLQVFSTYVTALNYMGSLGWELLQTDDLDGKGPSGVTMRFMLRRSRSSTGVTVTKQ